MQTVIIWLNTALAVVVPLFLWWRKSKEGLLFWIVFTCFTDVVGNQLWFNFSGFKIAGLVLFPLAFRSFYNLPKFLRNGIVLYLGWNVLRAAFVFEISKFSVLKQLGTQFSEFSVALILTDLIRDLGFGRFSLNMLRAIVISISGMAIELLFNFDSFRFFTGGRPGLFEHRVRGFSYEPRAAGYSMAVAMVTAAIQGVGRGTIPIFVASGICLGLTGSISSLGLAVMGLAVVVLSIRKDWRVIGGLVAGLLIVAAFGPWREMFESKYVAYWNGIEPGTGLVDLWIRINETADSATLNYLKSQPWTFWFGMGPGAQAVLSKTTLLPRDIPVWGESPTIPLPGFGYLLILSNIGIFGLFYYCWVFWLKPFLLVRERGKWFFFSLALFWMFLIQSRNLHTLGLGVLWTLMIGLPNEEASSDQIKLKNQSH